MGSLLSQLVLPCQGGPGKTVGSASISDVLPLSAGAQHQPQVCALCVENTDFSRGIAHAQPGSLGHLCSSTTSAPYKSQTLAFLTILHLPFLIHHIVIATPFPFPLQRFTVSLDEFMEDRG